MLKQNKVYEIIEETVSNSGYVLLEGEKIRIVRFNFDEVIFKRLITGQELRMSKTDLIPVTIEA